MEGTVGDFDALMGELIAEAEQEFAQMDDFTRTQNVMGQLLAMRGIVTGIDGAYDDMLTDMDSVQKGVFFLMLVVGEMLEVLDNCGPTQAALRRGLSPRARGWMYNAMKAVREAIEDEEIEQGRH